jgi:NADPH:quinone reductase-like Zn-dependent oxidoreductase
MWFLYDVYSSFVHKNIPMQAIVHHQYGPPEVALLTTLEKPIPKSNEVLIKVVASTVNRTDCGFRSAVYVVSRFWSGLFKPKHKILGCEFAGIVDEIGSEVKHFSIGDKVFGYNDISFGGHAEYLCIAENDAIACIPNNCSFIEAAAITEGAHYAWNIIRASKTKKGQQALVVWIIWSDWIGSGAIT